VANQHITAVYRCSQFKGTAREVLLYLANCASPGQGEDKKNLPLGYCKRKLTTIMCALNIRRQPTITAAIKELKQAGAIKQWLKKGVSPLYFVDLDWLKEHEFTDEQVASFDYEALKVSRKAFNLASGLPAGDPPYGSPTVTIGQRKATNLEYGNRLTSNTESVSEEYGKRLTPSHLFPPAEQGSSHLADARVLPTASRETASKQEDRRFAETQGDPVNPSVANAHLPDHSQPSETIVIPPAPPAGHYSHKFRSWESQKGKTIHDCEFCSCGQSSQAAQKPCRADSWSKDAAARWRNEQEQTMGVGA